ncbi:MAG: M23 family metallopeptidase [Acidobacteria bacterium]|nr:M23 family metallopeptidase [Acidobacteriota bacterium]
MPRFPLNFIPKLGFQKGSGRRWFGASRDHGERMHAGCDLIARTGTPIYAVAGGFAFYKKKFYQGTYELVVIHPPLIVRYGEIDRELPAGVVMGETVREGQHIANVGCLGMLHFEMYKNTASGELTNLYNKKFDYVEGSKFKRRRDLLDPTPFLERWAAWTDWSQTNAEDWQ